MSRIAILRSSRGCSIASPFTVQIFDSSFRYSRIDVATPVAVTSLLDQAILRGSPMNGLPPAEVKTARQQTLAYFEFRATRGVPFPNRSIPKISRRCSRQRPPTTLLGKASTLAGSLHWDNTPVYFLPGSSPHLNLNRQAAPFSRYTVSVTTIPTAPNPRACSSSCSLAIACTDLLPDEREAAHSYLHFRSTKLPTIPCRFFRSTQPINHQRSSSATHLLRHTRGRVPQCGIVHPSTSSYRSPFLQQDLHLYDPTNKPTRK